MSRLFCVPLLGLCLLLGAGCSTARQSADLSTGPSPQQASGQIAANLNAEVQAELAGLRQDVGEQINALKVDQSTNNWDEWSLRLLILSLGVTPLLGYVLPKMAWLRVKQWRKNGEGCKG